MCNEISLDPNFPSLGPVPRILSGLTPPPPNPLGGLKEAWLKHLRVDAQARRRTGGTVLLSYNNKPVMEAIPGLESVVSPIARALYSDSGANPFPRSSIQIVY